MKKLVAEFIGTAVLVTVACGVAITTGCDTVATSLAFGLVIVAMAYSVGNVSGCHINPAVSFGMLLTGQMSAKEFAGYVVAQCLGATAGAGLLGLFLGSFKALGGNEVQAGVVAAYGSTAAVIGLVAEVVLTFIFVFAILGVTSKKENGAVAGVVIGGALTLVHLLGLALTGTSVNPARSFGPALLQAFAGNTAALTQLWIFIVGPMVGAALAAVVFNYFKKK